MLTSELPVPKRLPSEFFGYERGPYVSVYRKFSNPSNPALTSFIFLSCLCFSVTTDKDVFELPVSSDAEIFV